MRISGIYKIQSKAKPERCYIGSSVCIGKRWASHLSKLRNDKHDSLKLQHHFNKYGESDLQFTILLGCEKTDLIKTEQYFIDSYNPYFNICKIAGNVLGRKMSEHTKQKIGSANKGKHPSEATILKMSERMKGRPSFNKGKKGAIPWNKGLKGFGVAWNKGKKCSEETRRRMSAAGVGRVPWNKGKKGCYSEEMLKRISEGLKGRKIPSEIVIKMAEAHRGLHRSMETRRKMKGKIPWNRGIKMTDEQCKNRKGRIPWNKGKKLPPHSEETKQKMRGRKSWNKGMKATPETCMRQRLAHIGQKAWNKGLKIKAA